MEKYTFRVDVIPEVSEEQLAVRVQDALVKAESDKYLISLEVAEKTGKLHYQGIVYSKLNYNTYKKRMENCFPEWKATRGCKGMGKRSFAQVKTDNYEVYVTKDDNIKYIKGYSDDEVEQLKAKSYKKSDVQVDKEDVKKNWFITLVDHCIKNGVTARSAGWEIAEAIIDAYDEYVKCEPNDFQLRCYAKSIQRHLVSAYARSSEKEEIWKNYKRARAKEIIGTTWVHVDEFDY